MGEVVIKINLLQNAVNLFYADSLFIYLYLSSADWLDCSVHIFSLWCCLVVGVCRQIDRDTKTHKYTHTYISSNTRKIQNRGTYTHKHAHKKGHEGKMVYISYHADRLVKVAGIIPPAFHKWWSRWYNDGRKGFSTGDTEINYNSNNKKHDKTWNDSINHWNFLSGGSDDGE